MSDGKKRILIMAGGTGGHIFPALSIAEKLKDKGMLIEWLGAVGGLETQIVGSTDIPLHLITVQGLRGKGWRKLLMAPFMLSKAIYQAMGVIKRINPDCVLGMGGFVTGPGGIAAWLQGRRLLIHEQNAVAGVTNKLLAFVAYRIMEAFPGTFRKRAKVEHTGNPVRESIIALGNRRQDRDPVVDSLRVLVLGGSQGAVAINEAIPAMLASWVGDRVPRIVHQTGGKNLEETLGIYRTFSLEPGANIQITGFIHDMAEMLGWADIVICRSGASTVCELAVAGLPAILIPYPHHKDNQQYKNAQWLTDAGGAILIPQDQLTPELLQSTLVSLDQDRSKLTAMSFAAKSQATPEASQDIAYRCMEAANA